MLNYLYTKITPQKKEQTVFINLKIIHTNKFQKFSIYMNNFLIIVCSKYFLYYINTISTKTSNYKIINIILNLLFLTYN